MGIKLKRQKPRILLVSFFYLLNRITSFLSNNYKLRLYLDLAWIFNRLAHEQSYSSTVSVKSINKDFLVESLSTNAKVLDLGCGRGYVMERIMAKTEDITGVDFDQIALKEAKRKIQGDHIQIVHDRIDHFLNQNNQVFDLIILSHVLEHMDHPESILEQLKTITSYLYIEVPDFESTHLNAFRLAVGTDLIYSDNDHVFEFDRDELQSLIEQHGFDIVGTDHRLGVLKFWCKTNIN